MTIEPAPRSLGIPRQTRSSQFPRRPQTPLWIVAALICGFLAPNSMFTAGGVADDSVVFAYIGWLMRRGYAPYRDVWDHKGPLLYYLNQLGWVITPSSTFGIGLLQALTLAVTFFFLFSIIKHFVRPAVIAVLAILSLGFIAITGEGGNMTESWAVAPISLAIFALFDAVTERVCWKHYVLIATAFTATLWLRPDLCLVPMLAAATLLYTVVRRAGPAAIAGFMAVTALTVALESCAILSFIWWAGTLGQLWAAYWVYNASYGRGISTIIRIADTISLWLGLAHQPLFIVAAAGSLVLTGSLRHRPQEREPLMPFEFRLFLVIALPLQLLAYLIPGRLYPHYLLSLWPTMMILGGVGGAWLDAGRFALARSPARAAGLVAAGVLIFAVLLRQVRQVASSIDSALVRPTETAAVADYIDRNTAGSDRILPVGDMKAVQIALYSRRLPAVAYVYQLSIVHKANREARAERISFVDEVRIRQPAIIFSMPSPVGSLCRSDELDSLVPARDRRYGYSTGTLPRELAPILTQSYELVENRNFTTACVYVRRKTFGIVANTGRTHK
jgi:hypothetical protein